MATVRSPLGPDALLLRRLRGREALGEPFELELELATERAGLDPTALLGHELGIELQLGDGSSRRIHGIVERLVLEGADRRFRYLRARLVPWLRLLSLRSDCRIFQDRSVPEIVRGVASDLGFRDLELRLCESHPLRPYTVQYEETDLEFVSRLLEAEGIGYTFAHERDRHALVLFDRATALADRAPVVARLAEGPSALRSGAVWSFACEQRLAPGAFAVCDWSFEQPRLDLLTSAVALHAAEIARPLELFDPAAGHASVAAGERIARRRVQASEADSCVAQGRSDCVDLAPGGRLALHGSHDARQDAEYLVLAVEHELTQPLAVGDGAPASYANRFACMPSDRAYRPPVRARRPLVLGPQTAIVAGPPGSEICTDEHGRVKLRFSWDRRGPADSRSSCWVRVSQLWAGQGFGGLAIPRVGQEVIVEFLQGDPERPIVTGRVYNAEQRTPTLLPEGAAWTGIRSASTPGGGGHSEISIDDRAGQELLRVRAERDRCVHVGGDDRLTVERGSRRVLVRAGDHALQAAQGSIELDAHALLRAGALQGIELACGASRIAIGPERIELRAGAGALIVGPAGVLVEGGLQESAAGSGTRAATVPGEPPDSADPA